MSPSPVESFVGADLEFRVVFAAARAAGVSVFAIRPPNEEVVGPAGLEDWDGWASARWPAVLGLEAGSWSTSPTGMGVARAREVIWCADVCRGDDGFLPHWLGFLHEVAHAAVGRIGGPVGEEDSAAGWEWILVSSVFGPLSRQARRVRAWSVEAGVDAGQIRTFRQLGGGPSDEVVAVARMARSSGPRVGLVGGGGVGRGMAP